MMTYKIIRFRINHNHETITKRTITRGLTLEEAQKHCSIESTHTMESMDKVTNDGTVIWFDGYLEEI